MQNPNDQIAIFKGKSIRKIIFQKEWWFSIVDVVQAITDSPHPKTYWAKMKERDKSLFEPFPFWEQLKVSAEDGKMRETDCANTEGLFRIVQDIPSPRVEPLKRWLAKVGYERIQEVENPELASKRMRALYKLKGYSDEWIEMRMRGIAIREELTEQWQKRGAEHKGMQKLKDDARLGGEVAGTARKQIERRIGRPVVSRENFLKSDNGKKIKNTNS